MLVKMIKTKAGPNVCYSESRKYDVDPVEGKGMIERGEAVFVKSTAKDAVVREDIAGEEVETASMAAQENASLGNNKNKSKKG